MVRIGDLSDELLVRILSFLPTSILSKKWEFLWMWLPKLEYDDYRIKASSALSDRDFIVKKLPLHRAPVIESLLLSFGDIRLPQPEKIKLWVGIAVSRFLRELSLSYCFSDEPDVSLPSSLYTCNSLTTLKLQGNNILVDVPPTVCLLSLKTLELRCVTYFNEDSLRLLISKCPVLEDVLIKEGGNVRAIVVNAPSLQRLVLVIGNGCSSDGYVIVTPSLKYFKILDKRDNPSCSIEPMPKLEEADVDVMQDIEKILKSVSSARRLSLRPLFYSAEESVYHAGIVFNRLQHLKLCIFSKNWSMLLVWLLRNSPKLQALNLYVDSSPYFDPHESVKLKNKRSSVPECLLRSLGAFEFVGFMGRQEERDFLSFFFEHASCLKSTSIIDRATQLGILTETLNKSCGICS